MWTNSGRIPSLDGLRAIAISIVTVAHLVHGRGGRREWLELGPAGVDLFFVISGFLITLLMLREESRSGFVSLRGFYRRRILRIFPAYYAFMLVMLLLSAASIFPASDVSFVRAATYTTNLSREKAASLGHTWSLAVEEHFYLIWPVAVALLGSRRAWYLLPLACAIAPVLRVLIRHNSPYVDIDQFTLTRLDTLAIGCLLAYFARSGIGERACLLLTSRVAWLAISIALATLILSTYFITRPGYVLTAKRPVEAVAWATIILACACRPPRLLSLSPVVAVGVLSYSLYLWQPLTAPPESWGWSWTVSLTALFAVAVASHFLIERPFLRMKDRPTKKGRVLAAPHPSGPSLVHA